MATVSMAPAENPTMPTRSGSTAHSDARRRTRANAARASATCRSRAPSAASGSCRCEGMGPASISRIAAAKPSRSSGVGRRRYFSTKAATPRSASARATFQPSFSMDRDRNPPPGATITAVPVAATGSGRKGVSVAVLTLRANTLPYSRCQASGAETSGGSPVPSSIASGWAGVSIGVIPCGAGAAGASPVAEVVVMSSPSGSAPRKRDLRAPRRA
ncbi:hypothetical protein BF93_11035 [Brachybacterium phenoliresistens]|uniref:Uncharacterized protein n=1 Tax=Brachybacterium phenoliresistens TaxID=396014 RepID=Z9JWS5_9MICO|nr:hypothetical protein BF93_11035 [Brachybacterium phenoliresistens]